MDVLYQQAIDKLNKGDNSGIADLVELANSNHILSIKHLIITEKKLRTR